MRNVHSAAELTYPEMFKTDWPIDDDIKEFEKAYQKGLEYSEDNSVIYIAANGGVYIEIANPNGPYAKCVSGLPVIGYHAGAYGLLWGLMSGISPVIYVSEDGEEIAVKGSGYLESLMV